MDQVEAFCAHLTESGVFDTTTNPTLAQVEQWLTTSHAMIAGALLQSDYAVEQTSSIVLGILEELNGLDTAIKVELNNPTTINGEPNDRFKWMQDRRNELLGLLDGRGLASVGAITTGETSLVMAITGTSHSEKESIYNDPDYIQQRFKRGFGKNPRAGANYDNDLDIGIIEQ